MKFIFSNSTSKWFSLAGIIRCPFLLSQDPREVREGPANSMSINDSFRSKNSQLAAAAAAAVVALLGTTLVTPTKND